MISSRLYQQLDEIFNNPVMPIREAVTILVSELEEECTILREKVEMMEYDLGLTGLEGDDHDRKQD